MALRNCLRAVRVRIARPRHLQRRRGHPPRLLPVSWTATVLHVRRGISVRRPAAPSNPAAECRDPHPEVSAVVHVWAVAAADDANADLSNQDAVFAKVGFRLLDGEFAEMKNRGGEHCARSSFNKSLPQVFERARTAGSNHGNLY